MTMSYKLWIHHAGGVSGSADSKVVSFSICMKSKQLREEGHIELATPGVAAAALRGDSRIFATAGWDRKVRVFHYVKRKPLAVLQYHKAAVNDVLFDPRTQSLASASKDSSIALWHVFMY